MREILSMETMPVEGVRHRTLFVSGECSLGYNESARSFVHDRYKLYLSGGQLRYFENLDSREKKWEYVEKLINRTDGTL